MKLAGKVTVVTGGANGIGEALCRRFAAEGAEAVIVLDLEKDNAEAVARDIAKDFAGQTTSEAYGCDVANEAELTQTLKDIEDKFGRIDVMFSNAGVGSADGEGGVAGPGATSDVWQKCWEINVMAHVYAARQVIPGMVARGEGYICSTSSAAGVLNQIGSSIYGTTKHAAVGFAENVAISHGGDGIKVSVLCPQAVATRMIAGQDEGGVQGGDGIATVEQVSDCVIKAMDEETFLILPHEEVLIYMQRKTSDYDRWIKGMQRWKAKFE
jgi:NAD(P)-dependent dehydrogenase (short-subunit alcohol dehydrogenase family)